MTYSSESDSHPRSVFSLSIAEILASSTTLSFEKRVSAQTSISQHTGTSVRLDTHDDLDLHLTGDLGLSLWGFEASTHNDTQWSGQRDEPINQTGTPLDQATIASRLQVLHTNLTGADLTFSFQGVPDLALYLHDITIEGTGIVTLLDPVDTLTSEALGEELTLEGDLLFKVPISRGDTVEVILTDAPEGQLDGRSVVVAPIAPGRDPTALWVGAGIMLLGVVVAVRRSRVTEMWALERRFSRCDYAWVARNAHHSFRSPTKGRRAAFYKAVSLLALGEYREARLFLADLDAERRPEPATFHFLQAQAAGGLGQDQVAAEQLARCLTLAPSYIEEARRLPQLSRALQKARVPTSGGEAYA